MLTERERFEEWIRENWAVKYHNFSRDENTNLYFYSAMQDAWDVWLGAMGEDNGTKNRRMA